MAKVTGVGGVFLRSRNDPQKLAAWYKEHLGVDVQSWGGAALPWSEDPGKDEAATAWMVFGKDSDKFKGSESNVIINYRVDDLAGMVAHLRTAGVTVEGPTSSEFGSFAYVTDPEGNKIELWGPN